MKKSFLGQFQPVERGLPDDVRKKHLQTIGISTALLSDMSMWALKLKMLGFQLALPQTSYATLCRCKDLSSIIHNMREIKVKTPWSKRSVRAIGNKDFVGL